MRRLLVEKKVVHLPFHRLPYRFAAVDAEETIQDTLQLCALMDVPFNAGRCWASEISSHDFRGGDKKKR